MMTDKEILLDLLDDFTGALPWVVQDLPGSVLYWQPCIEANSIGITLWHICRSFDVLGIQVLRNQHYTREIWHTAGWAAKTGYNPHGIGFAGWGTLSRFTSSEVAAVPKLSATELLSYMNASIGVVRAYISQCTPELLSMPPAGWPDPAHSTYQPATAYRAIRGILMDIREHLGEMKALKVLYAKRYGAIPQEIAP